MPDKAGHDGIQIDHDERVVRFLVEKNVVDLRVVMRHAQRQLSRAVEAGQLAGLLFNGKQPVKLFAHSRNAAARILRRVGLQLFVALDGIVKIRDGVVQPVRVEIGQHQLEIAERFARAAHDVHIVAGVKGDGGHVVAHAPETVVVHEIILAVRRMVEVQALRVRPFFPDVLRHAVDVLHQLHRLAERIRVHALHEIRLDFRHACAVVADIIDLVRMIYVSHFDFFIGEKRAGNAERFAHFQQLSRRFRVHFRYRIIHSDQSFSVLLQFSVRKKQTPACNNHTISS